MFKCMIPGGENPTDRNWMAATYISSKLENGLKLWIHSSHSLFQVIKPFTEGLFRSTFYHRSSINSNYAIVFKIEIRNEEEFVQAGKFYYRSDRNPFELKMEGIETNLDLFHYLDQPFKILVTTSFYRFHSFDASPKPLEKTFKLEECVICLEKEPKVLFCNCGHICICEKCIVRRYDNCPVCKEKSTILRMIE